MQFEKMYLVEPNGAIIRSGLVQKFAEKLSSDLIDENIAYLIGKEIDLEIVSKSFSTVYFILKTVKIDPKVIRGVLLENQFTEVVVKKRGVDIDPASFVKKIGIKKAQKTVKNLPHKTAFVILVRLGKGEKSSHIALICEKLTTN